MSHTKLAVLTTTRADYGLLYWVIRSIHEDPDTELLFYVTGSHLSPDFGYTIERIEEDGFPIRRRIEVLLASDSPAASTSSLGLALSGFGEALPEDRPDVMILLGDRFEIVPVALACVLHGIPVAHIHGGESSEGALDEYFRHAVTKLSTLHFPATEAYRQRILQMGEAAHRVHAFGSPGLDHLHRTELLSKEDLRDWLSLPLDRPTALVTYHPVTTEPGRAPQQVDALLSALLAEPELQAVFTKANADAEGRAINALLEAACHAQPERFRLFDNLGTQRYLSCLKHLDLMVGNSSSGLTEAPSFGLPAVNVGDRQKGRIMAKNVIQTGYLADEIGCGIRMALSQGCREGLRGMSNPYDPFGDGKTSSRIVQAVKRFAAEPGTRRKAFVDLEIGRPRG